MSINIRRMAYNQADFSQQMDSLLSWESVSDEAVNQSVVNIISEIRKRGDAALVDYSQKFDHVSATSMADLTFDKDLIQHALTQVSKAQRQAL